jgi:hypothetical protein
MDKTERLVEALRRLNREGPRNGARKEARALLAEADAVEVSLAEQRLIEEGMDPQALRGVCALHLEVMHDQLKEVREGLPPGHPLDTLYREHDEILGFLDALERLNAGLQRQVTYDPAKPEYTELKEIAEELLAAERHHAREEDVLFPELEKRGMAGPPRIMRMEHEDLRAHKRLLAALVAGAGQTNFAAFQEGLAKLASHLVFHLRDHIFKENTILYPAARQVIPADAWPELKRRADDIGYCCFTPEPAGIDQVEEREGAGIQVIKMEAVDEMVTPRGVTGRKLVDLPAVNVMSLIMKAGEAVAAHVTPVDVLFYVVRGEGTVTIGEESARVGETDLVVSPRGIPHGLAADAGREFQVLVIKTPNPKG